VHVVLRVGGVIRGAGRGTAVDVLLVAQLVVVQQGVVAGGIEEASQAGIGAGVDGQELLAVLPPVLSDVRRAVDGGRGVGRAVAALGFVDGVAQPDEVVEGAGAGPRQGGGGEVGGVGGVVGAHQAVGVAGEAELHRDVGRLAGGGHEGADL